MQPDSGIKTWQWVVTVIVIIILVIIGVMVFGGKSSQAPATEQPTTNTSPSTQNVNSIVMSDQYPGNVVYVSSVQMSAPGWVVIHKDNAGSPGDIIGETYVSAGINPVKITLSEPMIDGGTYYAMLHSDDGNKQFSATTDLPLKDASGNIIMKVFHASASAGANLKG